MTVPSAKVQLDENHVFRLHSPSYRTSLENYLPCTIVETLPDAATIDNHKEDEKQTVYMTADGLSMCIPGGPFMKTRPHICIRGAAKWQHGVHYFEVLVDGAETAMVGVRELRDATVFGGVPGRTVRIGVMISHDHGTLSVYDCAGNVKRDWDLKEDTSIVEPYIVVKPHSDCSRIVISLPRPIVWPKEGLAEYLSAQPLRHRYWWLQLIPLLLFCRFNRNNPLRRSILPLLPLFLQFEGDLHAFDFGSPTVDLHHFLISKFALSFTGY